MRMPRCYVPAQLGTGFYHVCSRIVDRRFIFGNAEKAHFLKLVRLYEQLCQVRVLTYCLMDNHFHLLVEVPVRPEVLPNEAELLEIIEQVFGKDRALALRLEWRAWREADTADSGFGEQRVQEAIGAWLARMYDISAFMKIIKQRFTQWYNKRNERYGTLWEDRFKSTIVEGGDALATIAAYIDLNPIRAGIVEDPKDYRWSGYGAATGGEKQAQEALVRVMELSLGQAVFAKEMKSGGQRRARTLYRERLLCWGVEQGVQANGQPKKRGMNPEKAAKELTKTGGQLSRAELVRCRVRYFSQGVALGSKEYVEEIFKAMRERFGEKRKDGARRLRGTENSVGLYALRDLGRVKADN